MKPSDPYLGTTVEPVTNKSLSASFTSIVLQFPVKHVADAANRTDEAAKKWRHGRACPDLASAINLGRSIPAVKWLLYRELERGTPEGIYSPRLMVEAMSLLQQIADGNGEHATTAREILARRP